MMPYVVASPDQLTERSADAGSQVKMHSSTSSSPKIQELRARYEALQAAAHRNSNSDLQKSKS